jgi:hypothetical protein
MKQDHELKASLIVKLVLICLGRFEFDVAACDREEIVRLTSQLWTHYDAGGACSECAEWKRRCEELDTKARMHEKQHAGLKEELVLANEADALAVAKDKHLQAEADLTNALYREANLRDIAEKGLAAVPINAVQAQVFNHVFARKLLALKSEIFHEHATASDVRQNTCQHCYEWTYWHDEQKCICRDSV